MKTQKKNSPLLNDYFDKLQTTIDSFLSQKNNIESADKLVSSLEKTKSTDSTIYLIGNGGSSAVAEHAAIDFTKNAGLKALTVSDSPMLTTFSNDYGYANVFKKFIESFGMEKDILIAISRGGKSENIINACKEAKKKGMQIVTLSGFESSNPLRAIGNINFWVDSKAFGHLEIIHGLVLHWINDSIIGSDTYMIR